MFKLFQAGKKLTKLNPGNILLGLILILLLDVAKPVNSAAPVTQLKLWTHQRHMAELTKKLINEFNQTVGRKKRIEVSVRILGDDSSRIFQEAQNNQNGPDLYSTNFNTGYADPFKVGARVCFDEFPGFRDWKNSWPSWYWIEGITMYRGNVFAIPVEVINSRLIYNRDLFRKIGRNPNSPPKSYAEVREISREITKKTGGSSYGFAYCGAESWPMEWMPSQWAEANGEAAYWDWTTGKWALNGYYRVFQLLLDLNKDGSLFPGTISLTNDALRTQFAEGRIGMFMGEFWDVGVFGGQFPAKCDWSVAPVPTFDGKFHGKSRAMIIGGYWSINGQSRFQRQAWEVVKWFSRYEIRAKFYENGKCIDPDPIVSKKYVKKPPIAKGFKDFADTLNNDYLASYPVIPGWDTPDQNPFTVFANVFVKGGNLKKQLAVLDNQWNTKLDLFYVKNPSIKREWNIYPDFDRIKGNLGKPLVNPVSNHK